MHPSSDRVKVMLRQGWHVHYKYNDMPIHRLHGSLKRNLCPSQLEMNPSLLASDLGLLITAEAAYIWLAA